MLSVLVEGVIDDFQGAMSLSIYLFCLLLF